MARKRKSGDADRAPQVSIVVPTYNRPAYLERALQSIAAQTFTDYETIVVNDGGQDVSAIVSRFERAVYLEHKGNRGLPAARNTALKNARGKYIAYLDDDDKWFPNHLEVLVSALAGADEQLVYSDCYYWINERKYKKLLSVDYSKAELHKRNVTPIICVMHERALLEGSGLFDESLPSHEDYDLWLRMCEITDFLHVPAVTCAYSKRAGGDQISADHGSMVRVLREVQSRIAGAPAVVELPEPLPEPAVRILLYCPTYEGGMRSESLESIEHLEIPDGVEVDAWIDYSQPHHAYDPTDIRNSHENTLLKYQGARARTLEGGYDYLLTFEHDMICPADSIGKLLAVAVDAGVVYGVYLFRGKRPVLNIFRYVNSTSIDQSYSFFPDEEREAVLGRKPVRCSGAGFGLTLIKREVLEKIVIRRADNGHPSPDIPFAQDCQRTGVVQMAHFGVLCGHIDKNRVLWPKGEGYMAGVKVKILVDFVGSVRNQSIQFHAGQVAELPIFEAGEYARAGMLSILSEPPAVKIVKTGAEKKATGRRTVKVLK